MHTYNALRYELLLSTIYWVAMRKSPAGFITLEVTAEVRIDASQR